MPAENFLDTNVIVYAFDAGSQVKQKRAKELLSRNDWQISWQVVQEFCSVALHRFEVPINAEDLADYVALKLWPRCRLLPSEVLIKKSIEIHNRFKFRFYDSLIIAAALSCGCRQLYSEDLQSGQTIGQLKIINPFEP